MVEQNMKPNHEHESEKKKNNEDATYGAEKKIRR